MKNLFKLAALIISTTVLSYAADTPDVPPLAGEDHQQRTVFYINSKLPEALNQDALRLSTLEERVKQHQELDSSPEDLATLKNDVREFHFSPDLIQHYKNASKTKSRLDGLREALTDKDIDFQKTLTNSGVYTEDAMAPIDAFCSHLEILKAQTEHFIEGVKGLNQRVRTLKGIFPTQQESSREEKFEKILTLFSLLEQVGLGQDLSFGARPTIIIPMGRFTSSNK